MATETAPVDDAPSPRLRNPLPKGTIPVGVGLAVAGLSSYAFLSIASHAMPEDQYGFKPSPEEMPFGALMWHIAIAQEYRVSQVAGVPFALPQGPQPADKRSILKGLAASFDHCAAMLRTLTPAQLDAAYTVDWVGMPQATGRQVVQAMFTHTAHHRGQAEVYLRLKGIKPPAYRY